MNELQEYDPLNETLKSRPTDNQTAPAARVLHVLLPDDVFNHVKAQAALSGLAFKVYMERYLREAAPYDGRESPRCDMESPASCASQRTA